MKDFSQQMTNAKDLTTEEQKKVGAPIEGSIEEEHRVFLQTLKGLIDAGTLDPFDTDTFIKNEVYDKLDEKDQGKTDQVLQNIAGQLRHINEFLNSSDTPDESPQLQTMVEQLWQMKQSVEKDHDVFVF